MGDWQRGEEWSWLRAVRQRQVHSSPRSRSTKHLPVHFLRLRFLRLLKLLYANLAFCQISVFRFKLQSGIDIIHGLRQVAELFVAQGAPEPSFDSVSHLQ